MTLAAVNWPSQGEVIPVLPCLAGSSTLLVCADGCLLTSHFHVSMSRPHKLYFGDLLGRIVYAQCPKKPISA